MDNFIVSITYDGTTYVVADGDLATGTTTRWYILDGVETHWVDGDPAPAETVAGTSNPKAGDIGAYADNFFLAASGTVDGMVSIDGIDYLQTIFPFLTDTFFLFERGGNDSGTYQAIYADDSLGPEIPFTASSDYANTGFSIGQGVFGVVFRTDVPVKGVRVNGSGSDFFSISTPAGSAATQSHEPEPADGAEGVTVTGTTLTWKTGVDPMDPNVPNPAITGHYLWLSPAFDPANPPSVQGWWNNPGVTVTFIPGNAVSASHSPAGLQRDAFYYWVVDESLGAASENDVDNLIFGNTWSFKTETTGPAVDAGSSIVTWLEAGSTTVDLAGTVVDLSNDVTGIQWSVLASPAGSTVSIANTSAEATTATLDTLGRYVLELYAVDATQQDDSDRIEINVYSDSCEAAKNHPDGYTASDYDFNDDCIVNFIDFAMFADAWLDDSALAENGLYELDTVSLPPVVQFTNPLNGGTVSGEVIINAIAYDPDVGATDGDGMQDEGIVRIRVLDGAGTVLGIQNENTAPFDMTWDTTAPLYPNGVYTIRVIAESDAGVTTTKEISVTVNN